ncbi:MAG: hypothetical protein IJW29_06440 [Clostridia bacterium]|nr:hypothetical protein [Clostridia bacterium]MBQ9785121.1 hypothetical protein [Clostridia bacterium]
MTDTLQKQVRRKLRVTWDNDTDTNARIDDDIIPNAEQDLMSLLGIPEDAKFDFATRGTENYLFLNHCWYQWEGVLDDFEKNYAAQIARCREKWMVKQYVAEQEVSADV